MLKCRFCCSRSGEPEVLHFWPAPCDINAAMDHILSSAGFWYLKGGSQTLWSKELCGRLGKNSYFWAFPQNSWMPAVIRPGDPNSGGLSTELWKQTPYEDYLPFLLSLPLSLVSSAAMDSHITSLSLHSSCLEAENVKVLCNRHCEDEREKYKMPSTASGHHACSINGGC